MLRLSRKTVAGALGVLLAGALHFGSMLEAPAQAAPSKTRRWRVIVIVPEQHLSRPRIPDPAVETKLCEQLIDAEYKVIDQDRIKELRYSAVMDRIQKGGPEADKEAMQLGRRFGADILITGEAFTQEVARRTVETDLGPVVQIQCRARVELKGIRMDTAEKFYAASLQKTGPPEPTEELSSKACLEETAAEMSAGLLQKLDKLALSKGQDIELEVRGISSVSLANQLATALEKVIGVIEVSPGDYDARTYQIELHVDKAEIRALAGRLESTPSLKRFNMKVQSANGSRIIVNCK